jgi:hypothetical protein
MCYLFVPSQQAQQVQQAQQIQQVQSLAIEQVKASIKSADLLSMAEQVLPMFGLLPAGNNSFQDEQPIQGQHLSQYNPDIYLHGSIDKSYKVCMHAVNCYPLRRDENG